jgi:hypothetical protein
LENDSRVTKLWEKLMMKSFRPDLAGGIDKFIDDILEMRIQLQDAGKTVDDDIIITTILRSLPSEYEVVKQLIRENTQKLTLEQVTTKIKRRGEEITQEKERSKTLGKPPQDSALYYKPGGNTKIVCNYCNKKGHTADKCWSREQNTQSNKYDKDRKYGGRGNQPYRGRGRQQARGRGRGAKTYRGGGRGRVRYAGDVTNTTRDDEEELMAIGSAEEFALLAQETADFWLVDSGASQHVTPHREDFAILDTDRKASITTANKNANAQVEGMGDVIVSVYDDKGNKHKVTIKNVWFVPDAPVRILSVIKLAQRGYKVTTDDCKVKIWSPTGNTFTQKVRNNNFVMKTSIQKTQNTILPTGVSPEQAKRMMNTIPPAQGSSPAEPETTHPAPEKPQATTPAQSVLGQPENSSLELWHRRLGHTHRDTVRHMMNHNKATGFKLKSKNPKGVCIPCIKAKTHRTTQKKLPATRATEPCSSTQTSSDLQEQDHTKDTGM